jgi:hypothetical protein
VLKENEKHANQNQVNNIDYFNVLKERKKSEKKKQKKQRDVRTRLCCDASDGGLFPPVQRCRHGCRQ